MRGGDQEALTVMNSEGSLLVMEWRGVTSGWRALMSFTQSTLVSATVPRNTSCTHTQRSSMKSQGYMRYNCHHAHTHTVEQHEVTGLHEVQLSPCTHTHSGGA